MRVISTLTVAVALACSVTACTGSSIPSPSSPPSPSFTAGQSIWRVSDGSGEPGTEAIPDDDAEVQSAQKVIALQTSAVDRRASETVSQDIATEMTFYTASFSEALRKDGYADKTVALFEDAQLTTAPLSISWYVSTLSADRTTGRAEIDATFEFTRADDDFLAKNRLALDTPYTQHRTIDLVKQDGRWLISNITRAPLTRTEGNGQ